MDAVTRAAAVYLFLVLILRIAGKRTLHQVTTFDIVLLLVISEATQQALLGEDFSITAAFLVITTLVGIDIVMSFLGNRWRLVDHILDSRPELIVDHGTVLKDRLHRHRMEESEILEAARELQGLERLADIKFAVLERSGSITIIPEDGN
ncbi:MAG: DUF421 domain-containing protein [Actinobacteria bacterium]|nr:DUF421 domain-containing protein [Actinomycetota bacterium]